MTVQEILMQAAEYMKSRKRGTFWDYEFFKGMAGYWLEGYEKFICELTRILKL